MSCIGFYTRVTKHLPHLKTAIYLQLSRVIIIIIYWFDSVSNLMNCFFFKSSFYLNQKNELTLIATTRARSAVMRAHLTPVTLWRVCGSSDAREQSGSWRARGNTLTHHRSWIKPSETLQTSTGPGQQASNPRFGPMCWPRCLDTFILGIRSAKESKRLYFRWPC